MKQPSNIIFFDGVCKFCNFWVNFALKHNGKKHLYFAPLQSDLAKNLLKTYGYETTSLSSVVFLKDNEIYTQSSAVCIISRELNWPWKIFYVFFFVPKIIRDFLYNIIAKYRYKWFGKSDTCRVPTTAEKERFLA